MPTPVLSPMDWLQRDRPRNRLVARHGVRAHPRTSPRFSQVLSDQTKTSHFTPVVAEEQNVHFLSTSPTPTNSDVLYCNVSSISTSIPSPPTLPSVRNSARSPPISSLTPPISSLNPRISPSNAAPASAPNPDSDSDFSFSFPFPFAATFLFFDDPASGPSFSAPTSQVFLMAWQDRHAVARGESLHRHSSPDFAHPTHTCPSLTLHLTPSSATTDPTV